MVVIDIVADIIFVIIVANDAVIIDIFAVIIHVVIILVVLLDLTSSL